MKEIWKSIKDYEGLYEISNLGRVRSLPRKGTYKDIHILKLGKNHKGYLQVKLSKDSVLKCKSIHRLVAETFIENKDNLPCINHKNEIKTDNNVNNLEWCSISYNNNYGERQKRVSKTQGKKVIGTNEIETLIFNSANEAEIYLKNRKGSNISQCANGKLRTAYGYKWRWA